MDASERFLCAQKDWANASNRINLGAPVSIQSVTESARSEDDKDNKDSDDDLSDGEDE